MDARDGIGDLSDGLSRTALTVAAQLGRQAAKVTQRALDEAAAQRSGSLRSGSLRAPSSRPSTGPNGGGA
ncbi:hypothetical protein ACIQC8_05805 [Agrococcus sediminis]|uniref:hypothetical protein n=1 Tax=Agrococcus sediminis TaxID=2599924 RepID=UPI00382EE785